VAEKLHKMSRQWEALIGNWIFYLRVVSDAEIEFAKKGDREHLKRYIIGGY
jgi:hypothetical protein